MRTLRVIALLALALCTSCAYSASKTVLVLGDSLSAEYGLARGTGWVSLLQKQVTTEKIKATIINASISGDTTSGGKARLPALISKHHPDIIIIELGANDGLRGLSLTAMESNLLAMIATAKNANAQVLLVGMQIPPNYGTDFRQKFSALYPRLAKLTQVPLVPFLLADIATRTDLFQQDRIHPNGKAHPIMLNNVWHYLKPLLVK